MIFFVKIPLRIATRKQNTFQTENSDKEKFKREI